MNPSVYALFKDGKKIGPKRRDEWSAALDAQDHDGIAETASCFGLDWLIHFKTGFEVRKIEPS